MNSSFLYAMSIIGAGVKIGPVAVLDEVGLFFYSIYRLKTRRISVKINIYTLMLFLFFIQSLVGLYYGNINVLRFIAIPVLLLISYADFENVSFKFVVVAAVSFLFFNIVFTSYGLLFNLNEAWWQEYFWTGTSYSAIGVFFSALILTLLTRNIIISMLIFGVVYLIGLLTDSRSVLLLSLFLLLAGLFVRSHGSKLTYVKHYFVVFITIGILAASYNYNYLGVGERAGGVVNTVNELVINQNEERDADRRRHMQSILQLFERDKLHFIFGHGSLSHQYDLVDYLPTSADGRVRTIGLTAMIFDGGVILFAFVALSAIWACLIIVKQARIVKTPFHVQFLCLTIPFVALMSIVLANVLEMVLWWLALAPKGLGYILLRRFQHSNYDDSLR